MRKKDSTLSNEVLENLNSQFSENHPYRRSFSGFAFQLQFGVALGDDMFYDSKAQSRAAGGFGAALVHTVEALEDPLLMLLGDADAGAERIIKSYVDPFRSIKATCEDGTIKLETI